MATPRTGMPVGRPTKFTEDTRTRIITALRGGNFRSVACDYADVHYSTFQKWLAMAEDPGSPPEYAEFSRAVRKAEADAEVTDVALIRRAAQNDDWRASAWLLERRNRARWGKEAVQVQVTGPDGGPVDLRVAVGADPASIENLAAALARRQEAHRLASGSPALEAHAVETPEGMADSA